MKRMLIAGLLVLCIVGCKREVVYVPVPVTPIPTPIALATPLPMPVVVATPPPHHFAPDGTFYVIRYTSLETDSGVYGIKPGTKITRIQDLGESIKASDGENQFTIPKENITNDLELAGQAINVDTANQASLKNVPSTVIIAASYGAPGLAVDVTGFVREEVAAGRSEIHVDGRLSHYKDPAFGKVKYLTVEFSSAGQTQTLTAKEGGTITLPAMGASAAVLQIEAPQTQTQYVPVSQSPANRLEQGAYHEKKAVTGRTIYYPH